mgnify:CR=1 FL=1
MLSIISDMIAYVFRLHDCLYVLHWLRSPIVGEAFSYGGRSMWGCHATHAIQTSHVGNMAYGMTGGFCAATIHSHKETGSFTRVCKLCGSLCFVSRQCGF